MRKHRVIDSGCKLTAYPDIEAFEVTEISEPISFRVNMLPRLKIEQKVK